MNRLKRLYHNEHFWHYIAYFLSLFGLAVACFLWYKYQQPTPIGCSLQGCETVRESAYASIGGIQVPVFGVIYYFLIAIYITSLFLKRPRWKYEAYVFILFNLAGALFSLYLTYVEVFVIQAICEYCVMSAVAAISIFIVSGNFLSDSKSQDLTLVES